jgi:1-acyl-sn-glycerol-3-phosphate acyltransferase
LNAKHSFFYRFFRPLATVFVKLKFGYKYEKAKDLPEKYIVLSNHVTDYDLVFVAASFSHPMYFLGSEHIARWKWLYAFLKFGFDPIMRPKGASAAASVMAVLRRVRGGASVCIFPEGVRSWDGEPCPIPPSTAALVKGAKCGLVTYKIDGGYFASPMWSKKTRRGAVHGAPVRVYTAEELAAMTNDEVYAAIVRDLSVSAYDEQKAVPKRYTSRHLAEGLENLVFICPECGERDSFSSEGDTAKCSKCACEIKYDEYGMLSGTRFDTVRALSDWQRERIAEDAARGAEYTAESASLYSIDAEHNVTPVCTGRASLSADKLAVGDFCVGTEEIKGFSMRGKRALLFSANKSYYEIIPDEGYNSLKFYLFYEACRVAREQERKE